MDYDKLIEQLNDWNEKYISNLCGDRTIKCEEYCIKDDCLIVKAATALSTLQAENKRLNKIVCAIPTTPDSGRTISQYDKEMSMCAYLDDLEAENEKLRAELEQVKQELDTAVECVNTVYSYILIKSKTEAVRTIEKWLRGQKED